MLATVDPGLRIHGHSSCSTFTCSPPCVVPRGGCIQIANEPLETPLHGLEVNRSKTVVCLADAAMVGPNCEFEPSMLSSPSRCSVSGMAFQSARCMRLQSVQSVRTSWMDVCHSTRWPPAVTVTVTGVRSNSALWGSIDCTWGSGDSRRSCSHRYRVRVDTTSTATKTIDFYKPTTRVARAAWLPCQRLPRMTRKLPACHLLRLPFLTITRSLYQAPASMQARSDQSGHNAS
jgi:hypothetical protein